MTKERKKEAEDDDFISTFGRLRKSFDKKFTESNLYFLQDDTSLRMSKAGGYIFIESPSLDRSPTKAAYSIRMKPKAFEFSHQMQ